MRLRALLLVPATATTNNTEGSRHGPSSTTLVDSPSMQEHSQGSPDTVGGAEDAKDALGHPDALPTPTPEHDRRKK